MIINTLSPDSSSRPPKLLEQLRGRVRLKHYSLRTEQAYVQWTKRYLFFHGMRHPAEMGKSEIEAFLTALAVERNVTASTQNQALSALLFLYREVLGINLPWLSEVTRAKKPARLPTVLTQLEARALLKYIDDPLMDLIVRLLYGTGMRLLECLRLRVKDVEFSRNEIVVRDGKGGKDRMALT
jgi:site-specific recombinase XerD